MQLRVSSTREIVERIEKLLKSDVDKNYRDTVSNGGQAVKWPEGEKPMMLLTTLNAVRTRKALWEVVQGYMTRWRVEDTIRYIKQSYRLEHMRLLDYQRLKNMSALVVAVAYFAAAWLGKKVKLDALARHVAKVSRKMFEMPEFFYYAIADGLRWLFVRHGRWRGWNCPREECGDLQMEFELLSG